MAIDVKDRVRIDVDIKNKYSITIEEEKESCTSLTVSVLTSAVIQIMDKIEEGLKEDE